MRSVGTSGLTRRIVSSCASSSTKATVPPQWLAIQTICSGARVLYRLTDEPRAWITARSAMACSGTFAGEDEPELARGKPRPASPRVRSRTTSRYCAESQALPAAVAAAPLDRAARPGSARRRPRRPSAASSPPPPRRCPAVPARCPAWPRPVLCDSLESRDCRPSWLVRSRLSVVRRNRRAYEPRRQLLRVRSLTCASIRRRSPVDHPRCGFGVGLLQD